MTLTKKDYDQIRQIVELTLEIKLDEVLDKKLEEKLSHLPSKEEFYKKMDEIMGELKTIREGQEILTHKVYRNHEPRISKVEKKLQIQSSV